MGERLLPQKLRGQLYKQASLKGLSYPAWLTHLAHDELTLRADKEGDMGRGQRSKVSCHPTSTEDTHTMALTCQVISAHKVVYMYGRRRPDLCVSCTLCLSNTDAYFVPAQRGSRSLE